MRSIQLQTRSVNRLAVPLLAAALLLAQAGTATATATDWSRLPIQTPGGQPSGIYFATLACPSASTCWASGQVSYASGVKPVMERLHKGKFRLVSTAVAGATLEGVTCRTTRFCLVSGYVQSTSTKPVLEKWNGHKWSKVTVANPKGDDNELVDPVCPGARMCFVVGTYGNELKQPLSLHPLLEQWHGKKWSVAKQPPAPANAQSASLNAITCRSKTSCIAVGSFVPKGGFDAHAYGDRLHGKTWSLMTIPQPFHGTYAYAADSDIKCTTAKRCVMTGFAAPDAQGRVAYTPEAWSYNGSTWHLLSLPKSYTKAGGALADVACSSTTTCWLVGFEYHASTQASGLAYALRWNGHSLTPASKIAQPSSGFNELDGTGCVHHGACYSIGDNTNVSGTPTAFADRAGYF
jgi:hypothetical protein